MAQTHPAKTAQPQAAPANPPVDRPTAAETVRLAEVRKKM
jgi:hypothetical protein